MKKAEPKTECSAVHTKEHFRVQRGQQQSLVPGAPLFHSLRSGNKTKPAQIGSVCPDIYCPFPVARSLALSRRPERENTRTTETRNNLLILAARCNKMMLKPLKGEKRHYSQSSVIRSSLKGEKRYYSQSSVVRSSLKGEKRYYTQS